MRKILFVASEAHPLIKTGGLGDVCGSLPQALVASGEDVRLLLPGYPVALARAGQCKPIAELHIAPFSSPIRLLETHLPGTQVLTWLIDCPAYARPGNPYNDVDGQAWPDNATRFGLLSMVAAAIAQGVPPLQWQPDIVHCHDWQTGLVPALLNHAKSPIKTVFTIHNLAYQGLFDHASFVALQIPTALWSHTALEFYGQLSFIKGGVAFADRVTTVSPNYAREMQTPEFGHGLDGLLSHRAAVVRGILNGIDTEEWNPSRDAALSATYTAPLLRVGKAANKVALQKELGLPQDESRPLLGMVTRLVGQKGIDLFVEALPTLLKQSV